MAQRGITTSQVETVLDGVKPFEYYHQGKWKLGYYSGGLFIAQSEDTIITVIADTPPEYIAKLKEIKP
jgi:hypothetical protein